MALASSGCPPGDQWLTTSTMATIRARAMPSPIRICFSDMIFPCPFPCANGAHPPARSSRFFVLAVLNEIVDHVRIGKRRGVAKIGKVVLGDLAQYAAHDLPRPRLG